jgi:hypothetical protein
MTKTHIRFHSVAVPKNPYKGPDQVRARMIPIRVSNEEWESLHAASRRCGVPISRLMREGAVLYAKRLERKDEPTEKED